MSKYYKYQKTKKINLKKFLRGLSLLIFLSGVVGTIYIFVPLISWQVYFSPIFAAQSVTAPIPKTTIVNPNTIKSLWQGAADAFSGTDYTNAGNWFPGYQPQNGIRKISAFTLSIPKLGIKNAYVSTVDNDLGKHLVNYAGTAIPPDKGTSAIFGHSTLPQLFKPTDYKTIFATLYTLKIGDEFSVNVEGVEYKYKIRKITIVEPTDTTIFTQEYDISHIILVTCTPPGTTWKRLVLTADLQKI